MVRLSFDKNSRFRESIESSVSVTFAASLFSREMFVVAVVASIFFTFTVSVTVDDIINC